MLCSIVMWTDRLYCCEYIGLAMGSSTSQIGSNIDKVSTVWYLVRTRRNKNKPERRFLYICEIYILYIVRNVTLNVLFKFKLKLNKFI